MSGLFITLEGIDGSGKSTQLEMLADALSERGIELIATREPGGTTLGEQIRSLLLAKSNTHLTARTELLLMVADRAQHVTEIIRPALESGKIVISDRYTDSSVAFQSSGRGIDAANVSKLNEFGTDGLKPDLTIVFDLEPELARERLAARRPPRLEDVGMTRFDEEEVSFHRRVRDSYLQQARQEPQRIRIVDASGSAAETHEQTLALVIALIDERAKKG